MIFYKKSNTAKVAFVAGKKVGNAVKRNRAKRVLRAHFIIHSNQISNHSYILVAKPQILNQTFAEREKQFINALKRIGIYKDKI